MLSDATRDELVDHIYLQRKLIRRLYKRIVELEDANHPPAAAAAPDRTTGAAASFTSPPMSSYRGATEEPMARDVSVAPCDLAANRLQPPPYVFPTSFQYSYSAGPAHQPPSHVSQRVVEEISRIDGILHAHEQGVDGGGTLGVDEAVLGDEALADLYRMRERLAVVLRTPFPTTAHGRTMSFSPPNADAMDEQHSRVLFRGMSAHTAPREKATAEDVLGCGQWLTESPMSTRTNTPFAPAAHLDTSGRFFSERQGPFGAAQKDEPLIPDPLHTVPVSQRFPDVAPQSSGAGARATPPRSLIEKLQAQLNRRSPWHTSPHRHQSHANSSRREKGPAPHDGCSSPHRQTSPWRSPNDCRRLLAYRQRPRAQE